MFSIYNNNVSKQLSSPRDQNVPESYVEHRYSCEFVGVWLQDKREKKSITLT